MKKAIIGCNIGSAFFMLLSLNFFEGALRFLMVGELPFIQQTISPEGMLTLLSLVLLASIIALLPRQFTQKTLDDIKAQTPRLPKRRYTRV